MCFGFACGLALLALYVVWIARIADRVRKAIDSAALWGLALDVAAPEHETQPSWKGTVDGVPLEVGWLTLTRHPLGPAYRTDDICIAVRVRYSTRHAFGAFRRPSDEPATRWLAPLDSWVKVNTALPLAADSPLHRWPLRLAILGAVLGPERLSSISETECWIRFFGSIDCHRHVLDALSVAAAVEGRPTWLKIGCDTCVPTSATLSALPIVDAQRCADCGSLFASGGNANVQVVPGLHAHAARRRVERITPSGVALNVDGRAIELRWDSLVEQISMMQALRDQGYSFSTDGDLRSPAAAYRDMRRLTQVRGRFLVQSPSDRAVFVAS